MHRGKISVVQAVNMFLLQFNTYPSIYLSTYLLTYLPAWLPTYHTKQSSYRNQLDNQMVFVCLLKPIIFCEWPKKEKEQIVTSRNGTYEYTFNLQIILEVFSNRESTGTELNES